MHISDDNGGSGFYIRRANTNRIEFWLIPDGGGDRLFTLTSPDYTVNTWKHYAMTYNNTEAKLYINSQLHQTVAVTLQNTWQMELLDWVIELIMINNFMVN